VEYTDVLGGRLDGRPDVVVDLVDGTGSLVGHVEVPDRHIVELLGEIADRHVTLRTHAVDDFPYVVPDLRDPRVPLE
jgi:hypothetical protein